METCTVMVITRPEYTHYYELQLPDHYIEDNSPIERDAMRRRIENLYFYVLPHVKLVSAKFDSIESKFPSSL